jgi:hypothetical protein
MLNIETTCLGIGTGFEFPRVMPPAIAYRDYDDEDSETVEEQPQ